MPLWEKALPTPLPFRTDYAGELRLLCSWIVYWVLVEILLTKIIFDLYWGQVYIKMSHVIEQERSLGFKRT